MTRFKVTEGHFRRSLQRDIGLNVDISNLTYSHCGNYLVGFDCSDSCGICQKKVDVLLWDEDIVSHEQLISLNFLSHTTGQD